MRLQGGCGALGGGGSRAGATTCALTPTVVVVPVQT